MTGIYSLAPVNDTNAALTTINNNIDGLETAIGTQADTPNSTGSLLGRVGAAASFLNALQTAMGAIADAASATGSLLARIGQVCAVLGLASATPGANTINANIVRNVKASAQCSSNVVAPASVAVAISTGSASTLAAAASAGTDWRRLSIYNSGSVSIFLAIGAAATASAYTMPVPTGYLLTLETLANVTALSSGAATNVLVTIET